MDAQQEALDNARLGAHVPLLVKDGLTLEHETKSTGTDVQTIML